MKNTAFSLAAASAIGLAGCGGGDTQVNATPTGASPVVAQTPTTIVSATPTAQNFVVTVQQ
jgi:ABC-type glycerol-3-phosphate transport system substrate-binding protein